ncbi:condensation domain-containing protein, partial [Microbulbifer sp. TYP-18]|uniref:condensation domain-containing protein n=1 Tax=Microbulbifer sp. TYP-18 TaxID=3230024 RepID=UPI0034C6404E
ARVDAIASEARDKLPGYMLPAFYQPLEALPLNAHGKIDRRLLVQTSVAIDTDKTLPREECEHALAALWQQLLAVETIYLEDNFFELGGHSLLVAQLVSDIRKKFNIDLGVRDLFRVQTLAQQAALISEYIHRPASVNTPIPAAAADERRPLSFGQERLWFLNQLNGHHPVYNIFLAREVDSAVDGDALAESLQKVLNRHNILTSQVLIDGAGPHLVQLSSPLVRWEYYEDETDLHRHCVEQQTTGFDLAKELPCRLQLLRKRGSGDGRRVLLFCAHHSVFDGWSLNLLFSELEHTYREIVENRDSSPQPLAFQYSDFSRWQRERWREDSQGLDYWCKQLAGLPPLVALPTDKMRPGKSSYRGQSVPVIIAPALARALKHLAKREQATLFMTLLAGFALVLARFSGQRDVAVGTQVANRKPRECENHMGFFVNSLVLRNDLSGDPDFYELLRRTRTMVVEAFAHQDTPFEKVVEALNPARSEAYSPLFQTMLTLHTQNTMPAKASVLQPALKWRSLQFSDPALALVHSVSRLDLSLSLEEREAVIVGVVEYNSDIFIAGTARRMVEDFVRVLEQATQDPQLRVADYPALSDIDQARLQAAWMPFSRAIEVQGPGAAMDEGRVVELRSTDNWRLPAGAIGCVHLRSASDTRNLQIRARLEPDGGLRYCGEDSDWVSVQQVPLYLPELEAKVRQATGIDDIVVSPRPGGPQPVQLELLQTAPVPACTDNNALGWPEEYYIACRQSLLPHEMPSYFTVWSDDHSDSLAVIAGLLDCDREVAGTYGPSGETEILLAQIWHSLLPNLDQGDSLSRIDDFFAVGGYSLLTVKLAAEIESTWQVSLAIVEIFSHPNIAAMGRLIDNLRQR